MKDIRYAEKWGCGCLRKVPSNGFSTHGESEWKIARRRAVEKHSYCPNCSRRILLNEWPLVS